MLKALLMLLIKHIFIEKDLHPLDVYRKSKRATEALTFLHITIRLETNKEVSIANKKENYIYVK